MSSSDVKIERSSNFFTLKEIYMTVYERQKKILAYIQEKHFSTVKELASLVWTSESSIRRDIKALEQKGFIKQIYGGVTVEEYEKSVIPLTLRDNSNSTLKEELAKRAAEYIFDGATIIMDGSSTVRRIIKYIDKYKNLKIITNNQQIFNECASDEVMLYCTGGRFITSSGIFVGNSTEEYIRNVNADILFFSSQAISNDGMISDSSEEETALRRIMLSRADKKIFLCDSSKLGQKRTFSVCSKDEIDAVICNTALPWEI